MASQYGAPVPASDLPSAAASAGAAVPASDLPPNLTQPASSNDSGAPSFGSAFVRAVDTPLTGAVETAAHEASQMAASPLASLASAYELAAAPSGEKARRASEASSSVERALTYQPRTSSGQLISGAVDTLSGIPGALADKAAMALYRATGSEGLAATADVALQSIPIVLGARVGGEEAGSSAAAEEAAANAARVAARAAHYIETKTALKWNQLSDGFKATMINIARDAQDLTHLDPAAVEREARASSLGVPITRGQATRSIPQLTAEENLRRSKSGQPLLDTQAKQDEALYHNLDVLRGQAGKGSKVQTPADVGKSVQGVIRRKQELLEQQRNELYAKAAKAGETATPVSVSPLEEWLKAPANKRNAGFIDSALKDYRRPDGTISINDLEEMRKEAVAHTLGPASTDTHYAGEAVGVIDDMLDQAGGDVFRKGRAAHRAIMDEFERQGMIRRLAGEKAKTTDRAIALEDTLDQVVIRGSNEDLQKVKETLLSGPTKAQGARAWADLQAGAIDYLKRAAGDKRGVVGEKGQAQFNGSFLDALHDLDTDGKLDTLFGPRIAERVRLLAKTVNDVRTTPTARISGSDTVPRIISMLEAAKHIPVIGPVGRAAVEGVRTLYRRGKEANAIDKATRAPLGEAAAKRAAAGKRISRLGRYGLPAAVGSVEGALRSASGEPDYGQDDSGL